MAYFVPRNTKRTTDDDWRLAVQEHIQHNEESVEQYDENGVVVGWVVQNRYE